MLISHIEIIFYFIYLLIFFSTQIATTTISTIIFMSIKVLALVENITNPKRRLVVGIFAIFVLLLITAHWKYNNYFPGLLGGKLRYQESRLAHRLLDGLRGVEIGASLHNPYGLNTLNVDYSDGMTPFKQMEMKTSDAMAKVHIVAPGDRLPFTNDSLDFVISSHVIEHFYDPIKAIQEWLRVVRPGGYVYMDIPHKERTFDRDRNRTTLAELLERHENSAKNGSISGIPPPSPKTHLSVWITEDLLELCQHFNWTVAEWRDKDDKTGIHGTTPFGFTIVIRKEGG